HHSLKSNTLSLTIRQLLSSLSHSQTIADTPSPTHYSPPTPTPYTPSPTRFDSSRIFEVRSSLLVLCLRIVESSSADHQGSSPVRALPRRCFISASPPARRRFTSARFSWRLGLESRRYFHRSSRLGFQCRHFCSSRQGFRAFGSPFFSPTRLGFLRFERAGSTLQSGSEMGSVPTPQTQCCYINTNGIN
ncbi:hypothetical protein PIB30_109004, partial [Stylosanthes scabra]|nr:hypothetical protein [Stylosanthes scabra]